MRIKNYRKGPLYDNIIATNAKLEDFTFISADMGSYNTWTVKMGYANWPLFLLFGVSGTPFLYVCFGVNLNGTSGYNVTVTKISDNANTIASITAIGDRKIQIKVNQSQCQIAMITRFTNLEETLSNT